MEDINAMQRKRDYITQLEKVLEEINKLYDFRDIYSIRPWDANQFSDRIEDMTDWVEYEIDKQTDKLNDLEVTIYNATKGAEN